MLLDPLILKLISIGFGLLFLLAAVHKFSTAQQFRVILEEYQVMPRVLAGVVARIVPLVEVVISVGWITGFRPGLVAISSAALLGVYTGAIGINLLRGRIHIGCGCGVAGSTDGDQQLSVSIPSLASGSSASFTIDVDDTVPSGALGLTMIAGSEMEQSKVTVTSSTNTPVSGFFDGNNKAVVELPDCV